MFARGNNDSGVVLIVVLWLLVILSMLAVGLGFRTGIELQLTKYSIGQLKAKYAAVAGIFYAMNQIRNDNDRQDTKYQCGFRLSEDQTPQDVLKNVVVGDSAFDIGYLDQAGNFKWGFADEESRININALNSNNYEILSHLIMHLGYDEQVAETISCSVIDWKDANNDVFKEPYGAEDDYYQGSKVYGCKNKPFDSVAEFMLVKGMTKEIFQAVKDFITVFPKQGNFSINLDTASGVVLQAYARSLTGGLTNTSISDADSLTEKIVRYRNGTDVIEATSDDQLVDVNEMQLNARERVLFLAMLRNRTQFSDFLRVRVKGWGGRSAVYSDIEAIIRRNDLSVVYWDRK